MKLALLLLVLPMAWLPCAAQTGTVTGVVTDRVGNAVPGAHVVVEATGSGTACDSEGRFRLAGIASGEQTLLFSAVGYQRRRMEVLVAPAGTVEVKVELDEQTLESGEVVVTAVRRPQATSLVPVSVSVLTRDDMAPRNVRTLDEALRYVPGVQLAENQVNIRGSSGFSYNVGSRVLLLVDGMPMLGPEAGGVPFDALPMPQVARIEVVKGPGSALYGSGALGGVINVITRDFPDDPETSVSLYGGVHDPVRHEQWRNKWTGATRYRGLGGFSLTHARKVGSRVGGWIHTAFRNDRGYLRLAADEVFQAYGKLGWDAGRQMSLQVLGGITARERDSFLYWGGIDDVLNPGNIDLLSPGATDATGTNDNRSILVSVLPSLRHVVNPTFFHSLRLRYFLVQIRPIDEFGRSRPLARGTSGVRFGGEWQVDWYPKEAGYLTAGISADVNAARSEFFRAGDDGYVLAQPELGAFGQFERGFGERLNVLVGLRADAYQVDTTTTTSRLSPRVGVSFDAGGGATVRAAFGQGFRIPGIAERYVDNQDFFPFFPNFRLKPELSTGYEAGVRIDRDLSGRIRFSLDVALFWNDYERLVEPKFVTDPENSGIRRPGFQFVNLTRARIRGAEIVADAELPAGVTVRAGYTYLDARDLGDDLPLVFRSRHLLKLSVEAQLGGALRIGADYRGASRPERVDSDFARFVPDAEVMVPMHVVDARIVWTWSFLTASVLITNALDYYYVERPAYLAPPRQFTMRLRCDL